MNRLTGPRHHILPEWAHRRPVTTFMVFCSVLIIGLFSYSRLPLEFAPEISHPWMWIFVPNPNSTPEENDKKIGVPLEENLKQIRNIDELEITSNPTGCSASIGFKSGTDMNAAYLDVRDACDRAKQSFPEDVDEIQIYHHKSDDWPILWMGIGFQFSKSRLVQLINDQVIPALERVDGVASVKAYGINEEELSIDMDLDKVRKHGIDIRSIYMSLRDLNRSSATGDIESDGYRRMIRPMNMLQTLENYRYLPIQRTHIYLKDIADIEKRFPDVEEIFRINGMEGVTLSIMKESVANTVAVSRKVHSVLDELKQMPDLKGIEFHFFFDQAKWIENSLRSLKSAGLWGGLFATCILFLFLRHTGITLVIVSAVPLSILAALIGIYFLGFSLNIGTMMGLMLAIGMLVDNSVVVSENIHRLWSRKVFGRAASVQGASEVGVAITASTFTTIIVFLPLVFSRGEMGIWMRQIGIPITLSLLASLFIALTLVPLAITRLLRHKPERQTTETALPIRLYRNFLTKILHARFPAFLIVSLLLLSMSYPAKRIEKSMNSGGGERQIVMRFTFPENYSLRESDHAIERIEHILLENKDMLNVKNVYVSVERNKARVRLFLKENGKDVLPEPEIKKRIRKLIPTLPGVSWWFGWHQTGSGTGSRVDITIEGNSMGVLNRLTEDVKSALEKVEGITDVRTNNESPQPEIHIHIDTEQARRNHVSVQSVAESITIALKGRPLPRFQDGDHEIDVRLQLAKDDRKTLQHLKNMVIYSSEGVGVPLQSLADFKIVPGRGTITRFNGKIQEFIQIETAKKGMKKIRKKIKNTMTHIKFPKGYTWHFGRSFRKFDEAMAEFRNTFLLALLLVIFLLGALFESLIHPFTIIFSLPLALVGVYWTQYLTDTVQDVMANIGLILLIGIVVNNAIVLVDHINQLRASGLNREDAIIQACSDRIRPIIMTASTTILGLSPMAAAQSSASGTMYAGMAITVMGGMVSATILTLLVLPLFYTIMDDLQNGLKVLAGSLGSAVIQREPDPNESK